MFHELCPHLPEELVPTEGSVLVSLVVSRVRSTCPLALESHCGEMDSSDVFPGFPDGKDLVGNVK